MKSIFKTILTTTLAVAAAVMIIPFSVSAAGKAITPGGPTTPEVKKQVGPNITAYIKDGVITLNGTGATYDYTDAQFTAKQTPFHEYCRWGEKKDTIKKIVIGDGITYIGKNLFYLIDCKTVQLGKDLTQIGDACFTHNAKLESINIPRKVQRIGTSSFENCKALSKITLGGSDLTIPALNSIGEKAFFGNKCSRVVIPANIKEFPESAFAHAGTNNDEYLANEPNFKYQIVITLDANGGSCKQPVMVRVTGNKYKGLPTPTRSGYVFSGWYYGTKKMTVDSTVKFEHKKLTAKWTKGLKQPSISSLSGVDNGFKIKMSSIDSNASKIIIQYSTDSGFNNCNSIAKDKSVRTTTIKNLKDHKKYYIRIRVMKNGKYSKWSGVKTVTTK